MQQHEAAPTASTSTSGNGTHCPRCGRKIGPIETAIGRSITTEIIYSYCAACATTNELANLERKLRNQIATGIAKEATKDLLLLEAARQKYHK